MEMGKYLTNLKRGKVKMFDKRLKDFFSIYDEHGTFHDGFLQSIDLSGYTDLTILNEITLNIMDYFLKNEIGNIKTMSQWNAYLTWDKEDKKYKINSDFYDSAKYSIYSYLLRSQRFFNLLNTDFRSLSANETESIVYGQKEEQKDYDKVVLNIERENDSINYGAESTTKSFGIFEKELEFGNTRKDLNYGAMETETEFGNTRKDYSFGLKETENEIGNTRKDLHYGINEKETEFGNTSETLNVGQQINSSDTTNQTHPFDMNTFLDDTASATSNTNGARSDTKTALTHTDTETNKAHDDYETNATHTDTLTEKAHADYETEQTHTDTETVKTHADYETTATHTDTETEKAHEDTETTATHTDTKTFGDITNTTDNRTDTTTIKTHTDTKTKTKIILISPDKYFEIMKELMSYNVYDILLQAVRECFTIRSF